MNLKSLQALWDSWTTEERMQWLAHAGFTGKDALKFHALRWGRLYWHVKCKLLRGITYESANLIQPEQFQENTK